MYLNCFKIVLFTQLFMFYSNFLYSKDLTRTYSVFHIKNLRFGKDITLGKHTLAFLSSNEKIEILGVDPPQNLYVKLGVDKTKRRNQLRIDGLWNNKLREFQVFATKNRNKNRMRQQSSNVLVIRKPPDLISIPLHVGKPIHIKHKMNLAKNVKFQLYSDRPFQISRK